MQASYWQPNQSSQSQPENLLSFTNRSAACCPDPPPDETRLGYGVTGVAIVIVAVQMPHGLLAIGGASDVCTNRIALRPLLSLLEIALVG